MRRLKDLICVRIPGRASDNIEAELRRLVTGVARIRERVERLREAILVLCFDGLRELIQRRLHDFIDKLRDGQVRVFVSRVKFRSILQSFVELIQLITRQWPVRVLAGEPQLHMSHLRECHDLAEAGHKLSFGSLPVTSRNAGQYRAETNDQNVFSHALSPDAKHRVLIRQP